MNNRILHILVLLLLCVVVVVPAALSAEKEQKDRNGVNKVTGTPVNTYLNINNISTVFWDNGFADIDNQDANSGLVYPKGSRKTANFKSGFLWGARYGVGGEVRVGGSAYRSGLQTGRILSLGVAEDPNLAKNRIYRVRQDIGPNADLTKANVTSEIGDGEGARDAIIAQYVKDWNEWPVADGAPFEDKNGNGTYQPAVDVPGVTGADQTIWFVANDLNSGNTTNLYGSNPMGVELQTTIWAYAQTGALGNMFFKKYLMINKGNTIFDSTFVTQWSDIDLGNSADDFSGCDTTRSLGYTYNANTVDDTYKPLPPPVCGFDFFQGPLVAGASTDSAIFKGKRVYGKKNLPMTAFYYFARGDASVVDPTQGTYEGTTQFYNFMQGKIGKTGEFFTTPGGVKTTFVLTGDPQTGQGWIDGQLLPAGDRRQGLASGPFRMAPGDTQEVVVAEICAGAIQGTDRLSCIGLLKFYDDIAQLAYNNFFQVPSPPLAPKVLATEANGTIILNWGSDAASVKATETSNNAGFAFQGYNVYQLPFGTAGIDQAKRLAAFDIQDGVGVIKDRVFDPAVGTIIDKVVQTGPDQGLSRSLTLTGDAFKGGTPLINGIKYYFVVTAYSFNPDPKVVPNNLENPISLITVTPHSANPGVRYQSKSGDSLTVSHTATGGPLSDGQVIPIVLDPTRVTGHQYQVIFDATGLKWSIKDATANTTVLANQTNQSGDADYLFADGMQVKVLGPALGMKAWSIAGTRRFSPVGGALFGLEGFSTGGDPNAAQDPVNGTIGAAANFAFGSITTTLKATGYHNVQLRLAAVNNVNLWDPKATQTDANFSLSYRYLRSAASPPAKPAFVPWIVNATAGYAYQDYISGVPFSAWDMETTPPTRLAIGHLENNQVNGLVDGLYWPGLTTVDNGAGTGPREFCFIFATPYTTTPDPKYTIDFLGSNTALMWVMTCARRAEAAWVAGDQFNIFANHVNTSADLFAFTAPAVTSDKALAKNDINDIKVFPNPYYGVNSEEINKYQRFVTFSHMPAKAVVRIFNLAGIMVRRIDKDDASQFARWDLSNDSGLPVGSGLYVAYIEMPDIGATKIVKIAVVQEQQVLDRF